VDSLKDLICWYEARLSCLVMQASIGGHLECMEILLQRGSNPDARDWKVGVSKCIVEGLSGSLLTHEGLSGSSLACVVQGNRAIHYACRLGGLKVVELLMDKVTFPQESPHTMTS
jgi:ankyrin repeat protein